MRPQVDARALGRVVGGYQREDRKDTRCGEHPALLKDKPRRIVAFFWPGGPTERLADEAVVAPHFAKASFWLEQAIGREEPVIDSGIVFARMAKRSS